MDIEQALEAFRILLTEQQNRVANMNKNVKESEIIICA